MKLKKKFIIASSIFGGITIITFFAPSISLLHVNSLFSFNNEEIIVPSQDEIKNEKEWQEAQTSLNSFYTYLNLHQYNKAREYLSEDFAKSEVNYSKEKLEEWNLQKQSDTKIVNIIKESNLSKETTKKFSYETKYNLKSGKSNCGERLTAYIVLRNDSWTIDTIHPNGYIKCE